MKFRLSSEFVRMHSQRFFWRIRKSCEKSSRNLKNKIKKNQNLFVKAASERADRRKNIVLYGNPQQSLAPLQFANRSSRVDCDNVKSQNTSQEERFEQLIHIVELINLRWWTIVRSRFIIRVSRVLRLRPTADSTVPNGPSCVFQLPFKVNLLSNLSWIIGQYKKSCNGKSCIKRQISM